MLSHPGICSIQLHQQLVKRATAYSQQRLPWPHALERDTQSGHAPELRVESNLDIYAEMKVASLNNSPSSVISVSPTLSLSESFLAWGAY